MNHKLEFQSGVVEIAERENLIHLQKMIECLKFLMGHPGFQHNQIYELCWVFNENKIEPIMKCIPVNDGRNNKKSTLFKALLYSF